MIVYGRNVALSYLENPKRIKRVVLQEGFQDKKIKSLIEEKNISYEIMKKKDLDSFAKGVHQGVLLEVEDYPYVPLEKLISSSADSFLVILDHLEDPHNLGAIVRTCEAIGADGIILPKDRGVSVNATVVKTSAGTIENVKVALVTNLSQAIDALKKQGYWIVGTAMDGEDYRSFDYRGKIALIIGNEGTGMGRLVRENCDFVARIPMYGQVNSLNASVSFGIMAYEVLRQKGK